MQTQRDHVHAHQFMMGRMSCALVLGDPASAEIPARRAMTGLFIGVLLVVLVAGGFAVYGWIVPGGSKAFREPGAILVEKESGARYVYLNGVLHPTPNLASAMLIQGPQAKVKLVSRASLKGLPRGSSIGIAGAPEILPAAADLVAGPWLACLPGSVPSGSVPSGSATDAKSDAKSGSVGVNLDPRVPADAVPDDRFVVVRTPDNKTFLLYRGKKHRVPADAVLAALGAASVAPVRAPAMWLAGLPDGPSLEPATIPRAGSPGPQVGGRPYAVGTLFRQQPTSGEEQLFVLREDGLAPLNRTEFVLLEAAAPGSKPVRLDTAALVAAPRSADRSLTARLPDLTAARWQDHGERAICLRQQPTSASAVASSVVFVAREHAAINPDGRGIVRAKPASGMVVVPVPTSKTGPAPDVTFVSDEGVAFRLRDAQAMQALKLNVTAPVPFPRDLLAALPDGPALSREAVTGPKA